MMSIPDVFSMMATLLEHLKFKNTKTSGEGRYEKKRNAASDFPMPTVAQVFGVAATNGGQTLTKFMRKIQVFQRQRRDGQSGSRPFTGKKLNTVSPIDG